MMGVPWWRWAVWRGLNRRRAAAPSWCHGSRGAVSPRTYATAPWRGERGSMHWREHARSMRGRCEFDGETRRCARKISLNANSSPCPSPVGLHRLHVPLVHYHTQPCVAFDLLWFTETGGNGANKLSVAAMYERHVLFTELNFGSC